MERRRASALEPEVPTLSFPWESDQPRVCRAASDKIVVGASSPPPSSAIRPDPLSDSDQSPVALEEAAIAGEISVYVEESWNATRMTLPATPTPYPLSPGPGLTNGRSVASAKLQRGDRESSWRSLRSSSMNAVKIKSSCVPRRSYVLVRTSCDFSTNIMCHSQI